jgi:hypothetical protein
MFHFVSLCLLVAPLLLSKVRNVVIFRFVIEQGVMKIQCGLNKHQISNIQVLVEKPIP